MPTASRLAPIVFASLVVLAGCGGGGSGSATDYVAEAPPAESTAGFAAQLDAIVPDLLRRSRGPGVAVAVVRAGRTAVVRGYGTARTGGAPVTGRTPFQVASISKPLTAWAVMVQVERGRLRLDAPVGPLLTRRPLPDGPGDPRGVTLLRLLSHTSGLPAHFCEARDVQPTIEACIDGDGGGAALARVAPPGSGFTYTNAGFLLAELVLEERTGRRFSDLMDEDVLRPLGMRDSTFADGPSVEEAANGLVSTADDLARFVAAFGPGPDGAAPGRTVLTPVSVRRTLSPAPGTTGNRGQTDEAAYGLGMALERLGPSGELLASHKGNNPGWTALIAALPARGEGLVVLSNGDQARELTTALLCRWTAWTARALPQRCGGPYVPGG